MSTRALDAIGDDALDAQAADWIVRLTADDVAERARARAGFEAWRRTSPRHAEAAASMESLIARVEGMRAQARPARAALDAARPRGRRRGQVRRAATALMMAFALALPVGFALQAWPPSYLLADMRTTTGEWREDILEDGTRLTLSGASAVNLRFDAERRTVELVRGEVLIEVARDPARPFLVETAHGRIRALGTRFVVRRQAEDTVLTMLESRVSVRTAARRTAAGEDEVLVGAGQRVHIRADGVGPVEAVDARGVSDAWRFHQLVVQGRPLPEVLDELGRHRPGLIRYDRERLQDIHVSAVLPLDDTGRALELLAASFPALRIRTLTPYLVMVDRPRD
ncbi:MAG: FecR domain-containing protein [Gammaproteobacteria bacterium]|nr:FecR domain-containing protein [Gammaproteobacteria bacterium]